MNARYSSGPLPAQPARRVSIPTTGRAGRSGPDRNAPAHARTRRWRPSTLLRNVNVSIGSSWSYALPLPRWSCVTTVKCVLERREVVASLRAPEPPGPPATNRSTGFSVLWPWIIIGTSFPPISGVDSSAMLPGYRVPAGIRHRRRGRRPRHARRHSASTRQAGHALAVRDQRAPRCRAGRAGADSRAQAASRPRRPRAAPRTIGSTREQAVEATADHERDTRRTRSSSIPSTVGPSGSSRHLERHDERRRREQHRPAGAQHDPGANADRPGSARSTTTPHPR